MYACAYLFERFDTAFPRGFVGVNLSAPVHSVRIVAGIWHVTRCAQLHALGSHVLVRLLWW